MDSQTFNIYGFSGRYKGGGARSMSNAPLFNHEICGLVSLRGTGRDDISMQFVSRDFRPCWIYLWVAFKLPHAKFVTSVILANYYKFDAKRVKTTNNEKIRMSQVILNI